MDAENFAVDRARDWEAVEYMAERQEHGIRVIWVPFLHLRLKAVVLGICVHVRQLVVSPQKSEIVGVLYFQSD